MAVMRFTQFIFLFLLAVFFPSISVAFAAPPTDFQTNQIIGSGLNQPTGFEIIPDGRIFILERLGNVRIYKNGDLLATPFVTLPSSNFGDKGLIGIAIDPDFTNNKWIYFYYTGADSLNRLVRFDATGDIATNGPVTIYQTNTVSPQLHVGGTVRFGNDNKLYLSIGDNGTSSNSQSLGNPFGKILRLNKDGTIPPDNPFVGQSGKLPEIWAYGLRNPFRFQFDSLTGRLFVGDVGDSTWEEVNLIQKGANYGWPTCEGICSVAGMTNPIHAYNHNGGSSAITGGLVYQGQMFPASYKGSYFFGDYAKGFIKRLTLDSDGNKTGVFDFDTTAGSVVDFKSASDGGLYYLTIFPGRLYKTTYTPSNQSPTASASSDKTEGIEPLSVNFSSNGSSDPEGQLLTFDWNFGDGTHSSLANSNKVYNNKGTYTIVLTVSDGINNSQAAPIIIYAGVRPNITINSPADGSKYKAGDTISYNATGTDGTGAVLPDSAFTTDIIFHHGTHIHPFLGPLQSRSGTFTTSFAGEPSPDTWYEIKVTGKDTNGLFTTKSIFIYPIKVNITYDTNPSGLLLLLDGIPINTANSVDQVVGYQRQLTAPTSSELNGNVYHFKSWSDGGKPFHQITIPDVPTNYIANYEQSIPFTAQYYNNMTLSGIPALTRQDKKIDFSWGLAAPDPVVSSDKFSARWTKQQYFVSGKYKFITTSDDGVRLYVDNNLVIDKWADQSSTTYETSIDLTEGNHDIKMEYYENAGGAVAKLSWNYIGDISTPLPPLSIGQGLTGQYFNNKDITSLVLTRTDVSVNFNWANTSPDPAIGADTFSVRWTGQVQPQFSELYTFYTSTDDGVRLWVNNQLLINKWIDQGTKEWAGTINLTAGQKYDIKMEYYENGGGAVAKLSWSSPSLPKQVIPNTHLFSTTVVPTPTPTPTLSPAPPAGSYSAQFWNTPGAGTSPPIPATPPNLTRNDVDINFNFGTGSPGLGINSDHFVGKWTKTDTFEQANYRFTGTADDGIRVFVDGQSIINSWIDQGPTTYIKDYSMTSGNHTIIVEYYENTGGALVTFSYAKFTQPAQTNGGLKGEYYNNKDFTSFVLNRIDPTVNFTWNNGSPNALISPDTYSVRWTGQVQPQFSELYTFYTSTDDGVRLWVNNQLLINKWIDQGTKEWAGTINLTAGQKYDIKMEYYENGGGAVAQFRWSSVSRSKQIIPLTNLYASP